MRPIKLPTVLAGLVVFAGLAPSANAGTLSYSSYTYSGENVHITDAGLGVNNEYGGAGLISLKGSTTMTAYCVDIADWLLNAGTYNTGVSPTSNPKLSGISSITGDSKIADIAALISNGTNDAAVQVAIWETEYGSAVTITPDDPTLAGVVSTYLADLKTTWTVPKGISLYELTPIPGQTNQTLVYLDPVPEPASIAILGSAIIGLRYLRKRGQIG